MKFYWSCHGPRHVARAGSGRSWGCTSAADRHKERARVTDASPPTNSVSGSRWPLSHNRCVSASEAKRCDHLSSKVLQHSSSFPRYTINIYGISVNSGPSFRCRGWHAQVYNGLPRSCKHSHLYDLSFSRWVSIHRSQSKYLVNFTHLDRRTHFVNLKQFLLIDIKY